MNNVFEQKTDSPKTINYFEHIKKQNQNKFDKNTNNNNPYMTQTFNINDLNINRKYNKNTLSQGNKSFMTTSQLLDYSIANEEIKRRKNLGILDITSHRNKDIFIETDSEQYNSRRNSLDSFKKKRKRCCSKLIVDKVTSHIPDTYYNNKGRKSIKSNNHYNPYNIQTYNSLDLNDINSNDAYEYEKSETITIKKVNYVPQITPTDPNNNINNKIEEKRILFHKIKNRIPNNNNINNGNISYNNIYDNIDPLINKEKDLNNMRRTNNISNFNSDYKYPFVIPAKNKKNNYVPYRNNNLSNDLESNNYNNYYKPEKDHNINNNDYIGVNENSEKKINPIKQKRIDLHRRRIYDNNRNFYNIRQPISLKLSNNNNNNIDEDYNENNIDSDDINSNRDNSNEKKDFDIDSKFKALYLNKDKEYNNLLDDYNDIVAKYNKLQRQFSRLINDKNDNKEENNNKNNNNNIEKNNYILDNNNIISISPSKNLTTSKSDYNIMNNNCKIKPDDDGFQHFSNNKENYKKKISDFCSNLKVEQNNNICILNINKKDRKLFKLQNESFNIIKKVYNKKINQIKIEQKKFDNNKLNEEKNNRIQLYYNNVFNKDDLKEIKNNKIQLNYSNKFNNEEFNEISNNQIQLNYEIRKFDENSFIINKENEINLKQVNNIKEGYKFKNNIYNKLRKKNNLCDSGTNPIKEININVINKENELEILSKNNLENKLNKK